MTVEEICKNARQSARQLAEVDNRKKYATINTLVQMLESSSGEILAANKKDVRAAQEAGFSEAMQDRLMLDKSRLWAIAADLRNVANLPDPVGEVFEANVLPNGLRVHKQRVPLGVLGVIYESRPNVTMDIAGLAIKSGNAVILRGGSETLQTNITMAGIIRWACLMNGLPTETVQLIEDPDRARVLELLQMDQYVDMIIPRGGNSLHQFCRQNSRIPVMTGGIGICHLFMDESADLVASLPVIRNAKVQRPTVCNALDTLLVHRSIAMKFLPWVVNRLAQDGVTFRVETPTIALLAASGNCPMDSLLPAEPQDFDTEWLSLVLGIKVVSGLDEAIQHIQKHSTGHSDGILTGSQENAKRFISKIDSAAVYVNASTRFTDGSQLGLGAEAAISTQRLHARGPLGLRELTTYKWVIEGDYTVRG